MLRAGFGTKLAWVADRDQEIVLVGRDDEDGRVRPGSPRCRDPQAWRLPRRRDDRLARRGSRRRRRDRAAATAATLHERAEPTPTSRSSTFASRTSGSTATYRARYTCPTTTSIRCRTRSTRAAGRGDLRVRSALGRGGLPRRALRRRARGPCGRRRRRHLGAGRLPGGARVKPEAIAERLAGTFPGELGIEILESGSSGPAAGSDRAPAPPPRRVRACGRLGVAR